MVLTFDIETKMTADEVGGWHNQHKMGVACLVVLDSKDFRYHVFSTDNVPGTESLQLLFLMTRLVQYKSNLSCMRRVRLNFVTLF